MQPRAGRHRQRPAEAVAGEPHRLAVVAERVDGGADLWPDGLQRLAEAVVDIALAAGAGPWRCGGVGQPVAQFHRLRPPEAGDDHAVPAEGVRLGVLQGERRTEHGVVMAHPVEAPFPGGGFDGLLRPRRRVRRRAPCRAHGGRCRRWLSGRSWRWSTRAPLAGVDDGCCEGRALRMRNLRSQTARADYTV